MKFFPIYQTIKNYSSQNFRWDALAGITLALFVLPESMAYATLAGLPPNYGIYCCLAGGLFFALFTSTQQVAVGPTSAISLMIGSGVSVLSEGNMANHIAIASLVAFAVFVFCLISYFLKLSVLVNFVGDNVLIGFKMGAALSIASTQLPILFGVSGGGENFFMRMQNFVLHLNETQWPVLAFGLSGVLFLFFMQRWLPGKPTSLLLVVLSILWVSLFPGLIPNLSLLGEIPAGLPSLSMPSLNFEHIDGILGLAFACFLVAYVETSSVTRTLAENSNQEPNLRQELLSLGIANFAVAFSGAYPVSGGLSQSQVNAHAGAKTPIALVICSVVLGILLLFFTHPLANLPQVILAALVLFAVSHLLQFKDLLRLKTLNKPEFRIALAAVFSVLLFGILKGVIISSFISLVYVIARSSLPHIAVLGRIPGTGVFTDVLHHPDNEQIPACILIRVESSILYYNQDNIFKTILQKVSDRPDAQILILDLSAASYVDVSGSKMIIRLEQFLRQKQIALRIVDALSEVREILRKQELEKSIGKISRRVSLDEAVRSFEQSRT